MKKWHIIFLLSKADGWGVDNASIGPFEGLLGELGTCRVWDNGADFRDLTPRKP